MARQEEPFVVLESSACSCDDKQVIFFLGAKFFLSEATVSTPSIKLLTFGPGKFFSVGRLFILLIYAMQGEDCQGIPCLL